MDELNDHKDESNGPSALTESHSPQPKSPSDDLMGLDFGSTPTSTPVIEAAAGPGSDGGATKTETTEAEPVSTDIAADEDDGFGDFGVTAPVATTAEDDDHDDGFGNFGAAPAAADPQDAFTSSKIVVVKGTESITENNDNDDDGFGDFGPPPAEGSDLFATAAADGGDDDGFGDFGDVQAGGDGDDDFGDFNDFGDDDGFQNSDDFGDFGGGSDANADDDPFGTSSEPAQPQVSDPTPPPEPVVFVETAPDFNAVNSRQVENYVLDKLSALYPYDDSTEQAGELLNTDLDSLDVTSVLSDQELWTSLCESSFQGGNTHSNRSSVQSRSTLSATDSPSAAPQFQWKYSILRKEYYASLGMVVTKEQNPTSALASSLPHSVTSPSASRSKVGSPLIMSTESIAERKPLDTAATTAYCQFTRETLGTYSGEEMKDIIAKLTDMTRQASDELTYWLDQREQMIMDNERYNEMIASLVGRAAKLKDAESKQKANTKRGITRNSFHLK